MGRLEKMKRLIIEEANKRILNEEREKQVSGPYGKPPIQYYVFEKGGKFYIYQTNASQKKPKLMDGTLWDNKGKGYDTENDAIKVILKNLEDTEDLEDTEEDMYAGDDMEDMDMGDIMAEPDDDDNIEVDV
jgi:hypothetical protein